MIRIDLPAVIARESGQSSHHKLIAAAPSFRIDTEYWMPRLRGA